MVVGVGLHPVHHYPETVVLTDDGQRERLSSLKWHPTDSFLGAPVVPLLGVSDHDVLTEARIIMESDTRLVGEVHVEPDRKQKRVTKVEGWMDGWLDG